MVDKYTRIWASAIIPEAEWTELREACKDAEGWESPSERGTVHY